MVTSRKKFMGNQGLFSFLTNANKHPFAIALVYSDDKEILDELKLTSSRPFLKLRDHLPIIQKHLVDLVVYNRRGISERCSVFEELVHSFTNKDYVLREFDTANKDLSLNRCTAETASFLPEAFKLGSPTPGRRNDCSGSRFLLSRAIMELTDPLPRQYRSDYDNMDIEEGDAAGCSSPLRPDEYYSVISGKVHQYVQTMITHQQMNDLCPNKEDLSLLGHVEEDLAHADSTLARMNNVSSPREWEDTQHFNSSWRSFISQHQKELLPSWNYLLERKKWFEYLPNQQAPANSTYRCRICSKYYEHFQLQSRYKPGLAMKVGVMYGKKKNYEAISTHEKSDCHQKIISMLQKRDSEVLPAQFDKAQHELESKDGHRLTVTMRMIRSVYAEAKVNLPFSAHEKIVELQERNGLDMGYHHYGRTAAVRIIELIGETMHESLVTHLTNKNHPLSIIIDSSTDSGQNHYLIVYFQALENEVPRVYFYKLILLDADESAYGLFESLKKEWTKEKYSFMSHLRKNLIGFASDGAAVMLGKHNGLAKIMNDWAEETIYTVHCMAHRLHLAMRKAVKSVPYYRQFEDLVNEVHNFYNRHGHKRKAHLRELAQVLNEQIYEFNYIFEIRWVTSEFTALKKLNSSWNLAVTDLNSISADRSFHENTRAQARGIAERLSDRNFMLIFQFTCDVLQLFSHWSKRVQQRAGILIGAEEYKNQMLQSFEELKTKSGSFMSVFLHEVACSDSLRKPCSLTAYDRSASVRYYGIPLTTSSRSPVKLETFREDFMNKVQFELEQYFPEGSLADFDVLDPKKLPRNESECQFYGSVQILRLAERFSIDGTKALNGWTSILIKIVTSAEFCRYQSEKPIVFWGHFLRSFTWIEETQKIVRIALVLPMGSADAERGFSIMNHVRTSRRSKLSPAHLEALLRLRINGPNNLRNFNAFKYAKKWVEAHQLTDDPKQQRKKRKFEELIDENVDENAEYFPGSSIF